MKLKATLMDSAAVSRALKRISFEIVEKNHGTKDLCLIGIRRRGVCIAKEIQNNIYSSEEVLLPTGVLDITFYRDDLKLQNDCPTVNKTEIDFDITDKTVILTDDVIFTGRTVRAAIDALFSLGRPKAIRFASLIDRGHRELPIKADYVGKNVPTSHSEIVKVTFPEFDGCEVSAKLYAKENEE
ncbi:MAG: bifunctional pyr operon transcriptional regulator/uracil phosphoribosyltransferase PyrR [Oscillospiraceae bacterium]|nr:bifunctional pyr operon transcriptional regulator/uracil phosphoribosyltransferase PyrR [Oscillospiraceae bacterium]